MREPAADTLIVPELFDPDDEGAGDVVVVGGVVVTGGGVDSRQTTLTDAVILDNVAVTVVVPAALQLTVPGEVKAAILDAAFHDAEPLSSDVVPLLYCPVNTRLLEPPTLRDSRAGDIARLVRLAPTIEVALPQPHKTTQMEPRRMADEERMLRRMPTSSARCARAFPPVSIQTATLCLHYLSIAKPGEPTDQPLFGMAHWQQMRGTIVV